MSLSNYFLNTNHIYSNLSLFKSYSTNYNLSNLVLLNYFSNTLRLVFLDRIIENLGPYLYHSTKILSHVTFCPVKISIYKKFVYCHGLERIYGGFNTFTWGTRLRHGVTHEFIVHEVRYWLIGSYMLYSSVRNHV